MTSKASSKENPCECGHEYDPHRCVFAGPPFPPCESCHTPHSYEYPHTEIDCLKAQIGILKRDRDRWKEAWWRQRDATGKVAWEYKKKPGAHSSRPCKRCGGSSAAEVCLDCAR